MKTKILLFLFSCLVLVGCNKKSDVEEPVQEEPTQQVADTIAGISEEQLKSYFPYKNGDRLVYTNDLIGNVYYTVLESSCRIEGNQLIITISTVGSTIMMDRSYFLSMDAIVTNKKQLEIIFQQCIDITGGEPNSLNSNERDEAFYTKATYSYDAEKDGELPPIITLSNGSIIKQNDGLVYFLDYDDEKWYLYKRQ